MYRPILITGASSGIGEACAVHLAHQGFKVYAAARRVEKLKALEGVAGGKITAIALDLTDDSAIEAALALIAADGTPLYGLVNNAGISVTGPIEDVPVNEWRRQFETNLFGVVALTQRVVPLMRASGRGRIVNIGSVAGEIASPFMGAYAASKHALEGLTDSLRRETAPFGIAVSLIRPGFVRTPFGEQEQDGLVRFAVEGGPYTPALDAFRQWHAKGHPGGANPARLAETVEKALKAKRPKARYTVPARYLAPLLFHEMAPAMITDRVFARITGISRSRKERKDKRP